MYSPCARVPPAYISPVACARQRCSVRVNNDDRERERESRLFPFFPRRWSLETFKNLRSSPPLSQIRSSCRCKESRKIDVRNVCSKSRHRHRPSVVHRHRPTSYFSTLCSRGHKSWRSGWNILSGRSGFFQRFSIAIAIVYRSYRW